MYTRVAFEQEDAGRTSGPGQRLLHCRSVEKIGEGGAGMVWKATDTTLTRFEREAKPLA